MTFDKETFLHFLNGWAVLPDVQLTYIIFLKQLDDPLMNLWCKAWLPNETDGCDFESAATVDTDYVIM